MPEPPPRLFHFSEDATITRFEPHASQSSVMPEPLVWAVHPERAYLYYFPRDCPRVTFYASDRTTREDRERFFANTDASKVAAIEASWLKRMQETALYRYEFAPEGFELHDEVAGYWVSRSDVLPLVVQPMGDLMAALLEAGVEVRVLPSLWPLRDAVVASTLEFSIIRWRNVAPRS